LILILIGFILGYKDGLVRKLIGLAGLIAAIILAVNYSEELGNYLAPAFNNEIYLAKIVAGIVIFLGTILFVSIIKRLIHPVDKVNKFINQFLGGIAGALQIVFVLSVFLLLLNILDFPKEEDKDHSFLYSSVYNIVPSAIELVVGPDFKPEGFLKDYIKSKDQDTIPDTFSTPPIQLDSLINND
jgi:membrane protein required for colicin V production